MKIWQKLLVAGALVQAGTGCGGDSTGTSNGTSLPNIVGSWHASGAVVTSLASSTTTANLIALGATLQIAFNANLSYSSTVTFPGQAPENSTGTYVETATQLTLHDNTSAAGDVITFSLSLSGGTLLLTGGVPFTFDFGSGEVPAKFDLTLVH